MQPRATAVAGWDSLITRTVLTRAGVYRWLVKREAVVAVTGLRLPSHSLLATRIADGFARLNGRDDAADTIAARREFSVAVSDPVAYRSLYPFARMRAFLNSDTAGGPLCERGRRTSSREPLLVAAIWPRGFGLPAIACIYMYNQNQNQKKFLAVRSARSRAKPHGLELFRRVFYTRRFRWTV